MLVNPHLYASKPTIEDECEIVVLDHVTHSKKRAWIAGEEELEDTPMKEEESEVKDEEMSPEKEESTDAEEELSSGCVIGFRHTEEMRNIVKTYMNRFYMMEDTLKLFKFTVPKA